MFIWNPDPLVFLFFGARSLGGLAGSLAGLAGSLARFAGTSPSRGSLAGLAGRTSPSGGSLAGLAGRSLATLARGVVVIVGTRPRGDFVRTPFVSTSPGGTA
jgi:hypothetical protein